MDFDLVVTSPVAGYEPGQRISDRDKVEAILADREQASHVVKVARGPAADLKADKLAAKAA